jgi:hypothetical protein
MEKVMKTHHFKVLVLNAMPTEKIKHVSDWGEIHLNGEYILVRWGGD